MNVFDQWVKHKLKAKYYLRYADDFVFFSSRRAWLLDIVPQIENFLVEKLRLTLHPEKIILKTVTSGVDFLGWVHFPHHRILRKITKCRMLLRIRKNPKSETLQSYLGLLKHGNIFKIRRQLLINYWPWQDLFNC
jgi:hypothetical protein